MDHRLRYCRAFTETELAGFSHFAAARERARAGAGSGAGARADAPSQPETILYLHRDLRVRAGVFDDDPVVFETDDRAWARFCSQELSFPPAWIAEIADMTSDTTPPASAAAPADESPPRAAR